MKTNSGQHTHEYRRQISVDVIKVGQWVIYSRNMDDIMLTQTRLTVVSGVGHSNTPGSLQWHDSTSKPAIPHLDARRSWNHPIVRK